MKKTYYLILAATLPLMVFLLFLGISRYVYASNSPQSPPPVLEGARLIAAEAVAGAIPIQGRLTDENGTLLSGTYNMTMRLYDSVAADATPICQETESVSVENGLFSVAINGCTSEQIDGRQLYLGIQVGEDEEMSPRQPIYPVPYAWTLRPGARIEDAASSPVLSVVNNGEGRGLEVYSDEHDAIYGRTSAADSAGVFGGNSSSGAGVQAYSASGIAVWATGTGVIQSTAHSYLWISGNALQKADSNDATRFVYDYFGGYKIYGGTTWLTNKTVVLPINIFGQLYGKDITVSGLDLYCQSSDDVTGVVLVRMRRQSAVNIGDLILDDNTSHCRGLSPQHISWSLTQNNVLSDQVGILYLALQLSWGSETSYVQIGGVRLTLDHD